MLVPASQDDNLCLIYVILCMMCSGKLFQLLTFYVDSVYPGPFGVSKPWYFPFVYLCRRKPSAPVVLASEEADDTALLLGESGRSVRRPRATTKSMEECEVLCSRVAIMVNGRLKCLGTCQHLKDRFGRGYSLVIQVAAQRTPPESARGSPVRFGGSTDSDSLDADTHDAADLTGQIALNDVVNQGLLQYHFPLPVRGSLDLGRIFSLIEANKARLNVINYSLSQTTLEQIFIDLAKLQQTASDSVLSSTWRCLPGFPIFTNCCSCPSRSTASRQDREQLTVPV
ncbi:unnamed protein product [Echinostoma caproni]|uniref:ABC transporter domain-containing protein n=1 Tax=Echinostoma caproni TaxID=27848 RepID=A0A183AE15_9TREM|nr:unnamed protein product [Echinostoma caproni]